MLIDASGRNQEVEHLASLLSGAAVELDSKNGSDGYYTTGLRLVVATANRQAAEMYGDPEEDDDDLPENFVDFRSLLARFAAQLDKDERDRKDMA